MIFIAETILLRMFVDRKEPCAQMINDLVGRVKILYETPTILDPGAEPMMESPQNRNLFRIIFDIIFGIFFAIAYIVMFVKLMPKPLSV